MDEKLLRYSEVLSVIYVFEQESEKTSFYNTVFGKVQNIHYSDFLQSQDLSCDIIFINFSSKDMKLLFSKISTLNAAKVILTPYESNATFLKNALKFKIDAVTAKTIDQTALSTLFQTLIKKVTIEYKKNSDCKRYETIATSNLNGYIIIENETVIYLSQKIKDDFLVSGLSEFIEKYMSKDLNLKKICSSSLRGEYVEIEIENTTVDAFIVSSEDTQEGKVISFTPTQRLVEDQSSGALSRLVFIEELKNHIVHQDRKQMCSNNLVMIKITNYETIIKEYGNFTAYQFFNEFARYLREFVDKDAVVASWGVDGFVVLSEKYGYDELKKTIESLTDQVTYKVFENSIVPFVKAAMIRVEDDDLNQIILTLDTFFKASVDLELAKKYSYYEACQIQKNMDDKETLFYYFGNMMYSQTPLKLLNIYKGVHISTTAYIEKIDAASKKIFVKAKNIQLYTMQIEKKTVIQSSSLPKDVEVGVDIVDLKKNIAVFSSPELLEFSANNRETTRVQSDFRFPVKVKQGKMIHSGEILDLSIRSLAIKFPVMIQKQFEKGEVFVSFRVPVETHDDGFFQTQIKGRLIKFDEIDHKSCKAIVLLQMEEPDEGYVLEYIYKRQKEIIFEIKKLALKGLSNGF